MPFEVGACGPSVHNDAHLVFALFEEGSDVELSGVLGVLRVAHRVAVHGGVYTGSGTVEAKEHLLSGGFSGESEGATVFAGGDSVGQGRGSRIHRCEVIFLIHIYRMSEALNLHVAGHTDCGPFGFVEVAAVVGVAEIPQAVEAHDVRLGEDSVRISGKRGARGTPIDRHHVGVQVWRQCGGVERTRHCYKGKDLFHGINYLCCKDSD